MRRILSSWYYSTLLAGLIVALAMTGLLAYVKRGPDPPIVVASTAEVPRPTTYQVMPGDSLWGIASKHYPGVHTGEIVHEIRKLNGLKDATIYPYTVLKLPEVE